MEDLLVASIEKDPATQILTKMHLCPLLCQYHKRTFLFAATLQFICDNYATHLASTFLPSFSENFILSWPTFTDTFETVKIPKGTLRNECTKRGNLLITFHFFVCQEKWNKMFLIKLREGSLVQSRRLDIRLWKSFTILSPFLAFFLLLKERKGGSFLLLSPLKTLTSRVGKKLSLASREEFLLRWKRCNFQSHRINNFHLVQCTFSPLKKCSFSTFMYIIEWSLVLQISTQF